MRVLVVEDGPYMAENIRDGVRLEAIAVFLFYRERDAQPAVHHELKRIGEKA
jgi:hypothetical protein